jgi:hypothetical protein
MEEARVRLVMTCGANNSCREDPHREHAPSQAELVPHLLRGILQYRMWVMAKMPDALMYRFKQQEDALVPVIIARPEVPTELHRPLKCGSKRRCSNRQYFGVKSNLKCDIHCVCGIMCKDSRPGGSTS